ENFSGQISELISRLLVGRMLEDGFPINGGLSVLNTSAYRGPEQAFFTELCTKHLLDVGVQPSCRIDVPENDPQQTERGVQFRLNAFDGLHQSLKTLQVVPGWKYRNDEMISRDQRGCHQKPEIRRSVDQNVIEALANSSHRYF